MSDPTNNKPATSAGALGQFDDSGHEDNSDDAFSEPVAQDGTLVEATEEASTSVSTEPNIDNDTATQLDKNLHTSFTVFPNLPLEMRNMIWENALPAGQYHDIRPIQKEKPWLRGKWLIASERHVPGIFFVNKEARAIVNRHYHRVKGSKSRHSRAVYVDPKRDIFCFLDADVETLQAWKKEMGIEMVGKVENLLLDFVSVHAIITSSHRQSPKMEMEDVYGFTSLKNLYVAQDPRDDAAEREFWEEIKDLKPCELLPVDFVPPEDLLSNISPLYWTTISSAFLDHFRRYGGTPEGWEGFEIRRGELRFSVKCSSSLKPHPVGPLYADRRHPWTRWIKVKVACWRAVRKAKKLLRGEN